MPKISSDIGTINQIFRERYFNFVMKRHPKLAEKLRKAFDVSDAHHDFEYWDNFLKENFGEQDPVTGKYFEIDFGNMSQYGRLSTFLREYAKINDISRRLRVVANNEYFEENFTGKAADSLEYVIRKIEEEDLSVEEAQEIINQMKFLPVMTSHPTNPLSTEYTKAAMKLVEAMSAGKDEAQVSTLLEEFFTLDVASEKKTQQQEHEEGAAYLCSVYDSMDVMYDKLEDAIDSSDKYRDKLTLPSDINDFYVWMGGDGDGNPNSTEEALRGNISTFKAALYDRYRRDLEKLKAKYPKLEIEFDFEKSQDPQEFIDFLDRNYDRLSSDGRNVIEAGYLEDDLEKLKRKVRTFGYHFARIDIRHEANDLMRVAASLLRAVGAIGPDQDENSLTNEDFLAYLGRQDVMERIAKLDIAKTRFSDDPARNELVKRIFGRFRVAAEKPEMFRKVIIAEFKEAKQISAVLMMLKASGNKVCEAGATLNIVPLAESKVDLEKLGDDVAKALKQPAYLEHVKQVKKVYFMIAKSDTVRRNGVGAQYAQEKAIRNTIKSIIRTLLEEGIEDLENYEIIPYNGGGHALQRGGGRLTEIASVYGRYTLKAIRDLKAELTREIQVLNAEIAAELGQAEETQYNPELFDKVARRDKLVKWINKDIGEIKISPPTLTTQGHQNGILYSTPDVAAGTSMAFASQAANAYMRTKGYSKDTEVDSEYVFDQYRQFTTEQQIQQEKERIDDLLDGLCEIAVDSHDYHIGTEANPDTPINDLFKKACWTITGANNKSSRPDKRKSTKSNQLLMQRAIGVEKLCAHTGTNMVTWFGWADALEEMKAAGEDLHQIYDFSKSFRDYMRSSAMAIYMADFETSWNMILGRSVPSHEDIDYMAASYDWKMKMKEQLVANPSMVTNAQGLDLAVTQEETMAFIQREAYKTKALIYEAINGVAIENIYSKYNILDKFPDIAEEIDGRRNDCGFANFFQSKLTNYINAEEAAGRAVDIKKDPKYAELKKNCWRAYCANDVAANAPLGSMLSLTKNKNVALEARQEAEADHEGSIPLVANMAKSCGFSGRDVFGMKQNALMQKRAQEYGIPASIVAGHDAGRLAGGQQRGTGITGRV